MIKLAFRLHVALGHPGAKWMYNINIHCMYMYRQGPLNSDEWATCSSHSPNYNVHVLYMYMYIYMYMYVGLYLRTVMIYTYML